MAFALIHLALFLGIIAFSIYDLIRGNFFRGLIWLAFIIAYYFIVLHPAVKKEIKRRKNKRPEAGSGPGKPQK
ncbi:MAG: hypothetical protein QME28_01140 [Candidatus Saccharicenans sp.]|nr:hypothetical protein [Candidatus Saccharicenans sp.]